MRSSVLAIAGPLVRRRSAPGPRRCTLASAQAVGHAGVAGPGRASAVAEMTASSRWRPVTVCTTCRVSSIVAIHNAELTVIATTARDKGAKRATTTARAPNDAARCRIHQVRRSRRIGWPRGRWLVVRRGADLVDHLSEERSENDGMEHEEGDLRRREDEQRDPCAAGRCDLVLDRGVDVDLG